MSSAASLVLKGIEAIADSFSYMLGLWEVVDVVIRGTAGAVRAVGVLMCPPKMASRVCLATTL